MGYIQLLKKGHWLATSQNYENRGKTAFKKKKKRLLSFHMPSRKSEVFHNVLLLFLFYFF